MARAQLTACPVCEAQLSNDARACPSCGAQTDFERNRRRWVALEVVLWVVLAYLAVVILTRL